MAQHAIPAWWRLHCSQLHNIYSRKVSSAAAELFLLVRLFLTTIGSRMVAAANMVAIVALVGDTARGLAYAATRVARHPPHLSWPAWAARDLRHGTSRQALLIAGGADVPFWSQTDLLHALLPACFGP